MPRLLYSDKLSITQRKIFSLKKFLLYLLIRISAFPFIFFVLCYIAEDYVITLIELLIINPTLNSIIDQYIRKNDRNERMKVCILRSHVTGFSTIFYIDIVNRSDFFHFILQLQQPYAFLCYSVTTFSYFVIY